MDKDTHANLRQKKSGVAILPTGKSRCQSRDDYQVQKWTVYILFVIPWTVAHQTRLSMEFSRQEYWSRKPFPSPGDLSNPRIKPRSPALQAVSLPAEPPGKPFSYCRCSVTQLVWLFGIPWTAACWASLSLTIPRSLPKFMSIELVMPSNHLILCCPLLLPSIFPSIRVFSNESALRIRRPKYWNFTFSIKSFQWIFRTDFL